MRLICWNMMQSGFEMLLRASRSIKHLSIILQSPDTMRHSGLHTPKRQVLVPHLEELVLAGPGFEEDDREVLIVGIARTLAMKQDGKERRRLRRLVLQRPLKDAGRLKRIKYARGYGVQVDPSRYTS